MEVKKWLKPSVYSVSRIGEPRLPLWVRFGLYRHSTGTSVPGGKADLNGAKADIAA